jgi:hypothetical protein
MFSWMQKTTTPEVQIMRGINSRFINDLKSGCLQAFLSEARNNPDICLEIRKDYINLYYKGGSALKISQSKAGYTFVFDSKYCFNKGDDSKYEILSSLDKKDAKSFSNAFPAILNEMDSWFACHPKAEREFQHRLIKSNTNKPAIVDIEYAGWTSNSRLFRLDMLGIYKTEEGYKIIIFENKYGNGAVSGNAGLKKHYEDIVDILSNHQTKDELIDSVINIVNNKTELGLMNIPIVKDDIMGIEILLLLADFNVKSKRIENEVRDITKSIDAKIVFTSSKQTAINYNDAKDLFAYEN